MARKIRAKLILQLRSEGLSGRAIASSQGMSRKSITAVLEAADAADVSWDDVADRPDDEVYDLLFPGRGQHHSVFAQPDWEKVHRELARVGVTLKLLHGEYTDRCAATGAPAMYIYASSQLFIRGKCLMWGLGYSSFNLKKGRQRLV